MAEEVKKNIGTCWSFDDDRTFEVKGRNLLTGGGAKLHGLDKYLAKRFNLKCEVAENPEECVAIGTGESFNLQGYLRDCISEANNRLHG